MSLATACAALLGVQLLAQPPQYPQLPSETPRTFTPVSAAFDYVRRDVMIPMRDGVKLHTVILVPKGAKQRADPAHPHAVQRRRSSRRTARARISGTTLDGYDNADDVIVDGGYIRVVQDVRGKYGSEGDYVMNRPLRGPLNPTPVDHATDTYDTIDWLVKNVPETQRQGRDPRDLLRRLPAADGAGQPASGAQGVGADEPDGRRLDGRRLVPQRRVPPAGHVATSTSRRRRAQNEAKWWTSHFDDYDMFMRRGLGRRARSPPRDGAARLLAASCSSTRPTTPSGRSRRWTRCSPRSR